MLALFTLGRLLALDPGKTLTQYAHRIWDQESGLSQPTVYAILQSHDGYLWLGTQDSLQRSDGVKFHTIAGEPGAPLHRALVRSLLEDATGNIWAGTIGSGLVRISPDGRAERVANIGVNVFCLVHGLSDRPGAPDLWICSDQSVAHWQNGKLHVYGSASGLPPAPVHALCFDAGGTAWAGTEAGLFRQQGQQQFVSSPIPGTAKPPATYGLACDNAHQTLWAGTDQGLWQRLPSGHWVQQSALPDSTISSLLAGHDGTLWVGTAGGFGRLRHSKPDTYRTDNGLSHSLVLAFCEDREGSLWVGTKNGLDQFTDSAVTPYRTSEGLSENSAGPVAQDRNGHLWVGTPHAGLNYFNGNSFHHLVAAQGLLSNTILSLAADPDGDLWVGTPLGVTQIHNLRPLQSFSTGQGLAGPVRALVFDAGGQLWAGTDHGLFQFRARRFQAVPLAGLPRSAGITSLFAGQQVRLFVGSDEPALYALHQDGTVSRNTDEVFRPVDALLADHEQREAWMGTLGGGLVRWKAGSMKRVRIKDGLYDNRIFGILRDDSQNLWIASSKGIFRVSQRELDNFADGHRQFIDSVPFASGQLRFECQPGVQPAAIRTSDGQLWFATNRGLVRIDPHQLVSCPVAPLTHIDAVLVDGRSVLPAGLTVRFTQRNLEIRYAGLSFRAPEKVSFRYQLQGFDRSWIDAGQRRAAFYTNLPPGNFSFQVLARSGDGVWSRTPATLRFRVEPRLYQRRWFLPALVLLFGVIAWVAYRLRIRRLQSNFQLVLAERSRIARELHDTLLQGLTAITMQLQALLVRMPPSRDRTWLADIIRDASHASGEARRGLLGLRGSQSVPASFDRKLALAARQAVKGHRLALELDFEPLIPALPPATEHQLLRIAEEAFSNVVTHAQAAQMSVGLRASGQRLHLTIADDGVGFQTDTAQRFGHLGLQGMEERGREIGATVQVVSSPGAGTRLTIVVPLHPSSSLPQNRNPIPVGVHPTE